MPEDRNLVQAVLKALEILEEVCREPQRGVRELSEKVGINRSTVNRLVNTLERAGYLEQDKERGKYHPTLKIFEMGNKVVQDLNISELAYPIMQKLSVATEETIYLAVLDGDHLVYVAKIDSPQMLKCSATIGIRPPVYCSATGKVFLAYLTEEKKKALLPTEFLSFGPNTISSVTELETELAAVKQKGYATDDEEWNPNIRALAAPILDYDRKIIATLSIAGPLVRMPQDRIEEIARILKQAAEELSTKAGYRKP